MKKHNHTLKPYFEPFGGLRNCHSQAGITLLLSVMILAAVTAVSFSLGALVLRELKSSRYLSQSEPVISSANAGAETALFFRLRDLNQYTRVCPGTADPALSNGSVFTVCNNYFDNPYILATSSTSMEVLVLDDPSDSSNPIAGYSTLEITATSGSASTLEIEAYDLYATNPAAIAASTIVPGSVTLSGLNPNTSYAVFFKPVGPTADPNAGGSITANGGSKGIPSKNPQIISTGSGSSLTRKLEILLKR